MMYILARRIRGSIGSVGYPVQVRHAFAVAVAVVVVMFMPVVSIVGWLDLVAVCTQELLIPLQLLM